MDAGKIASLFAKNIFRNQNVYSSPDSSKWESYKSETVREMFCKTAVLQNPERDVLQDSCSAKSWAGK